MCVQITFQRQLYIHVYYTCRDIFGSTYRPVVKKVAIIMIIYNNLNAQEYIY